jgi:FkbM family methyltransferase
MTQIKRQPGRWNLLSAVIHPTTLILLALALSVFSIILIIYDPTSSSSSRDAQDAPLFRGGNSDSKINQYDQQDQSSSTIVSSDNGVIFKIEASLSGWNPLDVWDSLLKSSSLSDGTKKKKQVVIEVGVHSPKQCINAAELGYDTHCFEPSPKSFNRVENGVKKTRSDTRDRIHLHNEAVGSTSGQTIPFHSTGGTGDHVGEYDMWKMKRRYESNSVEDSKKRGTIVHVPTVRLDDFIGSDDIDGDKVFLLKIDTQGFEPSIFNGLEKSIKDASIDYIIFEFWPRGMDLLADTSNECTGHKILDQLIASGYTLYALSVESHPRAPLTRQTLQAAAKTRPYKVQSTKEYCQWFFELENKYPSKVGEEEYKFGYWSDFLAVAPGVDLPNNMK